MRALISDIHGNYEALKAVFADIDSQGIKDIFFLGDVTGYGPEPEECIELLRERCSVNLMGNHDWAMLNAPVGFNPIARGAIECLKSRMEPGLYSMPWKKKRWEYLGNLAQRHMVDDFLFVHASPREPIMEYVLPTDPEHNPEKCEELFLRVEKAAFCGHTHLPGVLTEEPKWINPSDIGGTYEFGNTKAIINIGSVGQPRDKDPRACYVVMDESSVSWRRVEYDIDKTIEKIQKIACLHERNGERLKEGR